MATPLRVPIRPRGRRPGYTSADAASHPPGAPTSHGARGRINVVLRQRCQNRSDPGRPPLTRRRRTDHGTPPAARGPSRLPRPRLLAVVDRAEPPGPSGPLQPEPPTAVDDHAAHRVDLQCGEVADRPSSSHRTRSAISRSRPAWETTRVGSSVLRRPGADYLDRSGAHPGDQLRRTPGIGRYSLDWPEG